MARSTTTFTGQRQPRRAAKQRPRTLATGKQTITSRISLEPRLMRWLEDTASDRPGYISGLITDIVRDVIVDTIESEAAGAVEGAYEERVR